jgi:hypothetical protein
LEGDIIKFLEFELLEQRKSLPMVFSGSNLFGSVDYEKDLNMSLENDDFQRAKTVIKNARKEYTKLSRNSLRRKTLDLVMDNLKKEIFEYAQKNNVFDDEELSLLFDKEFEEKVEHLKGDNKNSKKNVESEEDKKPSDYSGLENNKEKDSEKNKDKEFEKNTPYNQHPSEMPNRGSQNIFLNRELSTLYQFPLDFDSLDQKQRLEKTFLEFKQKLEKEAQKKYDEINKTKIEEQKALMAELNEELKSQNKKAFEQLKEYLIKKFGAKYFQEVNELKENIEEKNKIINSLKQSNSKISSSKEQVWTNEDDHNLIQIIIKQMSLLKQLLKEKKYLEANQVFFEVSLQAQKLHNYKKEKIVFYIL